MISFRLSDTDYESMKRLCQASSARSVSEFARSALQRMMSEPTLAQLETKVNALDGRLSTLDRKLADLAELIGNP